MTIVAGRESINQPRRGRARARLEAIERRLAPVRIVETVVGHPLPELAGASAAEIAVAFLRAISEAHGDDPLWADDAAWAAGHGLCPQCLATLDAAVRLANGLSDPAPWPNPLLRVFENELMWRSEMERWAADPAVTFDRAAWDAEHDRMRAERFYTNHFRDQTPPWVILGHPDDAL